MLVETTACKVGAFFMTQCICLKVVLSWPLEIKILLRNNVTDNRFTIPWWLVSCSCRSKRGMGWTVALRCWRVLFSKVSRCESVRLSVRNCACVNQLVNQPSNGQIKTAEQRTIIQQYGNWYTGGGRWWVLCYIWYSQEEPGRAAVLPSPLLAVPNVTTTHQRINGQCTNFILFDVAQYLYTLMG